MNRRTILGSTSTSRTRVRVSRIRSCEASHTSDSCTRYRMISVIIAGIRLRPNIQRHDSPSQFITNSDVSAASR
jgi:hypothetical protein